MELLPGQMVESTKVSSRRTSYMEKEPKNGQMVAYTKVTGLTGSRMAMANTLTPKVSAELASGREGKSSSGLKRKRNQKTTTRSKIDDPHCTIL